MSCPKSHMFRGWASGTWLDYEDSKSTRGLMNWWDHTVVALLKVMETGCGVWLKGVGCGSEPRDSICPWPISLSLFPVLYTPLLSWGKQFCSTMPFLPWCFAWPQTHGSETSSPWVNLPPLNWFHIRYFDTAMEYWLTHQLYITGSIPLGHEMRFQFLLN